MTTSPKPEQHKSRADKKIDSDDSEEEEEDEADEEAEDEADDADEEAENEQSDATLLKVWDGPGDGEDYVPNASQQDADRRREVEASVIFKTFFATTPHAFLLEGCADVLTEEVIGNLLLLSDVETCETFFSSADGGQLGIRHSARILAQFYESPEVAAREIQDMMQPGALFEGSVMIGRGSEAPADNGDGDDDGSDDGRAGGSDDDGSDVDGSDDDGSDDDGSAHDDNDRDDNGDGDDDGKKKSDCAMYKGGLSCMFRC